MAMTDNISSTCAHLALGTVEFTGGVGSRRGPWPQPPPAVQLSEGTIWRKGFECVHRSGEKTVKILIIATMELAVEIDSVVDLFVKISIKNLSFEHENFILNASI